jgi:hypothetical protein
MPHAVHAVLWHVLHNMHDMLWANGKWPAKTMHTLTARKALGCKVGTWRGWQECARAHHAVAPVQAVLHAVVCCGVLCCCYNNRELLMLRCRRLHGGHQLLLLLQY